MNDTPDNASQSFDAASYVALKLAEDTALAIFTDGITDQKAEAAFKLIDRVAPKDKIDIAIFIANYAGPGNKPVRTMALQKAFDILEEVPADQRLDGAKKMFKNAPAGTDLSERAFVAVLENLSAVKGDEAIIFSMQFKTDIYHHSLSREPTPEIISQKTRAVDLVVELLEKYPDFEFRDSLAGKLVRDVAQVDPEKREELLKRLEAISPKSTMRLSIAEKQPLFLSPEPSVQSQSIEARRLARELLGPALK